MKQKRAKKKKLTVSCDPCRASYACGQPRRYLWHDAYDASCGQPRHPLWHDAYGVSCGRPRRRLCHDAYGASCARPQHRLCHGVYGASCAQPRRRLCHDAYGASCAQPHHRLCHDAYGASYARKGDKTFKKINRSAAYRLANFIHSVCGCSGSDVPSLRYNACVGELSSAGSKGDEDVEARDSHFSSGSELECRTELEGDELLRIPFIHIPAPAKKVHSLRAIRLRKRHAADRRKTMREGIWSLDMEKPILFYWELKSFDEKEHKNRCTIPKINQFLV